MRVGLLALPEPEMDLREQRVPVEGVEEAAVPQQVTDFHAEERDERRDADVAGDEAEAELSRVSLSPDEIGGERFWFDERRLAIVRPPQSGSNRA